MTTAKTIVLILCTGNACRSQMAEALMRKHQGSRYTVYSAGTDPKRRVHPLAVQVMDEIGLDISGQHPKPISDFLGTLPVKHLLIVCDNANQTCPRIWPGTYTRTCMPFDDPAEARGDDDEKLEVFRRVRDEIDMAMNHWAPKRDNQHQPSLTATGES